MTNNIQRFPISEYQKRFLLEWALDPKSCEYNVSATFEIIGSLNSDAFKRACEIFILEHEIVQATYNAETNECFKNNFQIADIYTEIYVADSTAAKLFIIEALSTPFNIEQEPLIKLYLIKTPLAQYFSLKVHHIIADAVFVRAFFEEIAENYYALILGKNIPLTQAKCFAYAIEVEKTILSQKNTISAQNYWLNKLANVSLNLNFYKNSYINSEESSKIYFNIEKDKLTGLNALVKETNGTLFIVLSSLFGLLLSKYANNNLFAISYPINMRQKDFKNILGCFVNNLPLVIDLEKNLTVVDLIQDIAKQRREVKEHQFYSLTNIIQDQRKLRHESEGKYFNVAFVETNLNAVAMNLDGLKVSAIDLMPKKKGIYDLHVAYDSRAESSIKLKLEYNPQIFEEKAAYSLIEAFTSLIEQCQSIKSINIKELCILNQADYKRLIYDYNQTNTACHITKTIPQLFEEQVKNAPDNIAIICGDSQLTYKELDEKSNQLAVYLRKLYTGHAILDPETLIGLFIERSVELVIGMLSVLKVGAAYVPIDTNASIERIQYIVKDTKVELILYQNSLGKLNELSHEHLERFAYTIHLIDINLKNKDIYIANSSNNYINTSTTDDLAYVIYTSGTTGNPKGVMIEHRSIASLVLNNYIQVTMDNTFIFLSSPAFDAATFEVWTPLLHGAKLIIPENLHDLISDTNNFKKIINTYKIDILWLTKTLFEALYLLDNTLFAKIKYLLIGGEQLNVATINKLIASEYKPEHLINAYGPTESTTFTTMHTITQEIKFSNVPIGEPIANRTTYILDDNLIPLPLGSIGELYIGGIGLARGYLNCTSQNKFMQNPFAVTDNAYNTRLYKTGDLCRYLTDGSIEFISRNDDQVKINGYRIEPSEIENVLKKIKGIKQAAVVVKNDKNGKYLCGYYILEDKLTNDINKSQESPLNETAIYNSLLNILPTYSMPKYLIEIDSLPININGKLDKHKLPAPQYNKPNRAIIKKTILEESLCAIFSERLLGNGSTIGIDDNVFACGLDSIIGIQVCAQIRKHNYNCTYSDIVESKNIANLAKKIAATQTTEEKKSTLNNNVQYIPLMPTQARRVILNDNPEKDYYTFINKLSDGISFKRFKDAWKNILNNHLIFKLKFNSQLNCAEITNIEPTISKINLLNLEELKKAYETWNKNNAIVYITLESSQEKFLLFNVSHFWVDGISIKTFLNKLDNELECLGSSPIATVRYDSFVLQKLKYLEEKNINYKDYLNKYPETSKNNAKHSQMQLLIRDIELNLENGLLKQNNMNTLAFLIYKLSNIWFELNITNNYFYFCLVSHGRLTNNQQLYVDDLGNFAAHYPLLILKEMFSNLYEDDRNDALENIKQHILQANSEGEEFEYLSFSHNISRDIQEQLNKVYPNILINFINNTTQENSSDELKHISKIPDMKLFVNNNDAIAAYALSIKFILNNNSLNIRYYYNPEQFAPSLINRLSSLLESHLQAIPKQDAIHSLAKKIICSSGAS